MVILILIALAFLLVKGMIAQILSSRSCSPTSFPGQLMLMGLNLFLSKTMGVLVLGGCVLKRSENDSGVLLMVSLALVTFLMFVRALTLVLQFMVLIVKVI